MGGWMRGIGPDGTPKAPAIGADGAMLVEANAPITASPLVRVSDSFTRPNTVTQYAAQDEVSNSATQALAVPLHFVNVVSAVAGTGYLVKAAQRLIVASVSVTNAVFRLHLFRAAPTMVGDNLAWPFLSADSDNWIGYVDFALITEGAGSTVAAGLDDGLRLAFQTGAASRDLWGVILAKAAFTPIGLTVVKIDLVAEEA